MTLLLFPVAHPRSAALLAVAVAAFALASPRSAAEDARPCCSQANGLPHAQRVQQDDLGFVPHPPPRSRHEQRVAQVRQLLKGTP